MQNSNKRIINIVKADVKNFLADLKQVGEANAVSIKIPSTKKKATFKQFNVTQQKKLLRSAFDGVELVLEVDDCVVDWLLASETPQLKPRRLAS